MTRRNKASDALDHTEGLKVSLLKGVGPNSEVHIVTLDAYVKGVKDSVIKLAGEMQKGDRPITGMVDVSVSLPRPDDLVRFGLSARRLPPQSELADLIGPVYDTTGVRTLLDRSRQEIADRRRRGTILALRTSDDVWVYPAFQFADGEIVKGVRTLLDVFRQHNPSWWTVAAWFASPKEELDGLAPIDHLGDAEPPPDVLDLAHAAASRWAA